MSTIEAATIQYLVLERRDPACNRDRFYVLSITSTLFAESALVRHWGRKGQHGRSWIELHADDAAAGEALETWLRRKVKRGYNVMQAA